MNILTIDLEEWYIYEQYPKGGREYYLPVINKYLNNILDYLDENNTKATFFCLGVIARNEPSVIKSIAERGHEIGCHSDRHLLVNRMTPNQFKEDTKVAVESLQQLTGEMVRMYRAPAFSVSEKTKWALEILIEQGIYYDSSFFPAKNGHSGFSKYDVPGPALIETNSGTIKEFPVGYVKIGGMQLVFSGGGYFRLFPYNIIRRLMKKSEYNMAYFHIRDLDSKQKKVCSLRYFQSYYGINGAYDKFLKIINEFNFVSLGEAADKIDWANINRFRL
jgi:polysaccharide deacetylase family protein (PEP-CTERM system associated)